MVETAQVVGSTEAETEEKPIKMAAATIWCDTRLLKEFKAAVKLQGRVLADELNELFRRRLAEFRGVEVDPNSANAQAERLRHYESLRKRQFELHKEQLGMLKFFEDHEKGFLGEMVRSYVHTATGKASVSMTDMQCWGIICANMDSDQQFRRDVYKFLAANPNNVFAYDFIHFLEQAREKRKLQREILQFQAWESARQEEYDKLEEEERLKREEEAKAEEHKRLEEAEQREREEETEQIESGSSVEEDEEALEDEEDDEDDDELEEETV